MFEILKSMMKEEWRSHSTMFGSLMFFLFPVVISIFAFIGTLFLPILKNILPTSQIALLVHYVFVLFGLSVGAFGLFGREVMNRRFGQASMIAYSSRTLPVSEREIFLNFFIKDVIYYFFLWILPFVAGFASASPFISISLSYSWILAITLTLSFLIGLSISFFFSTIYVHSLKLLVGILFFAVFLEILASNFLYVNLLESLPSLSFFFSHSVEKIILSLGIIIVLSSFSIIFLKVDYPEKKRRFKNSLDSMAGKLKFGRYSFFIVKDFLDLKRSEGGVGKIIFSFLFPLAVIWLLLSVFLKIIPFSDFTVVFAVFLGVISSSMYNWLTEFDLFTSYSFLPVKVSTVIKSKLGSYILINSISLIILILVTLTGGSIYYFLPAVLSFLAVSSYTLSVTVYLTGLYPGTLLYNAKIFLLYFFLISPILLVLIFLSLFNPLYLFVSPLLAFPSFFLLKKSFAKWDEWNQPTF